MNFFGIIGVPLGFLISLIYGLVKNYALAIIIFTIFFKFCVLPLYIKNLKVSVKTSVFKPYTDEINRKYSKDIVKRQEELQKLNKEYGISLTAGCLPALLPLIFLFGILDVVYHPLNYILHIDGELVDKALEIFKVSGAASASVLKSSAVQFSLIGDVINFPERYGELGESVISSIKNINLDFFGFNIGEVARINSATVIFPILAFLFSFLQIFVNLKFSAYSFSSGNMVNGSGGVNEKVLKYSMFVMPFLSCYIALTTPIGVSIYWIIGYIFQVFQIIFLSKFLNVENLKEKYRAEFEKIRKHKKVKEKELEDIANLNMSSKDRILAARAYIDEKYGK